MFTCYWNNVLVAMFSVLNQPSGSCKYAYRVHRAVVLPDYQGLGIGTKLFDFFGKYFLSKGNKLFLRSTHIRLANHCRHNVNWIESNSSNKISNVGSALHEIKYRHCDRKRTPFSFEYVGENYVTKPHQPILCLGEVSKDEARKYLNKIINKNKFPIIVTGVADSKIINIWEEIAIEQGIRTEILFVKAKGKLSIVKKYLSTNFDAIIIGRDNQKMIGEYRHAKDIRQLITFNYKHEEPKYYERLVKGEPQ